MSLAQYASTHSWNSRSGSRSARKNGGKPPRSNRWARSGRPKSAASAAIIGVSHTSSFRPANVSRKRAAAMIRQEGFRVVEPASRAGQLAVEVLGIERLAKDAFARAAYAHEPHHGLAGPGLREAPVPERAREHDISISYG